MSINELLPGLILLREIDDNLSTRLLAFADLIE